MSAPTVPAGVGPDDPDSPNGPDHAGGTDDAGAAAAGVVSVDQALAARNREAAEYLAGLIADAQLDTVGTPRQLPQDLFGDDDPDTVRRVWARALVVGVRAGQFMHAPRFYRDKLHRLQGELSAAGYEAMGRAAGHPLAVTHRYAELRAVDDEDARGH